MTLAEKFRYLRTVEGQLRGLGREMSQGEVVRAIRRELKRTISQPYLSQIESGKRQHLTNSTRLLLAKFFNVHPGFLVNDPEGYHTELLSDVRMTEDQLDLWLVQGAERFCRDAPLAESLLTVARHEDSRRCLLLLNLILETPALLDRLWNVLRPEALAFGDEREQAKGDSQ
jgi:transcriptional regulator with XRE-family HTH domain